MDATKEEIRRYALLGLEYELAKIHRLIRELDGVVPGDPLPSEKRRMLSEAARKRMAKGQKKRWAAARKVKKAVE